MTQPNPDLSVNLQRLADWNTAGRRRQSFRSLQEIHRRGLSFRAPAVLPLAMARGSAVAMTPALERLIHAPSFCALVIAQEDLILFEHYAPDFAADQLHSLQSITKTFAHLAMARLIESGRVDPARPVGNYVPEAGDAYVRASVQQVLDMDVASNFAEDYDAPYAPCPPRGAPVGYSRQEIAMGWRLPPPGEPEFGVRGFAAGLVAAPRGSDRTTRYTSPNTDMLGWIIERASGRRWNHDRTRPCAPWPAHCAAGRHIPAGCDERCGNALWRLADIALQEPPAEQWHMGRAPRLCRPVPDGRPGEAGLGGLLQRARDRVWRARRLFCRGHFRPRSRASAAGPRLGEFPAMMSDF
jgi:CubicO group peptidase (beta-lactamase class C family)